MVIKPDSLMIEILNLFQQMFSHMSYININITARQTKLILTFKPLKEQRRMETILAVLSTIYACDT